MGPVVASYSAFLLTPPKKLPCGNRQTPYRSSPNPSPVIQANPAASRSDSRTLFRPGQVSFTTATAPSSQCGRLYTALARCSMIGLPASKRYPHPSREPLRRKPLPHSLRWVWIGCMQRAGQKNVELDRKRSFVPVCDTGPRTAVDAAL